MLPFSHDEFLAVFRDYNFAIWPAQLVAFGLGAAILALLLRPSPGSARVILAILALMWLWTGVAYHWLFFSRINDAATLFAGLFVLQAAALLGAAGAGRPGRFQLERSAAGMLGLGFCVYALLLYPLIGFAAGQSYPAMPSFGVTPCPVVIFTFGILLLGADGIPLPLLVLPGLWSLIGGSAAFLLHVPQDWILLASGLIAVPLVAYRRRIASKSRRST